MPRHCLHVHDLAPTCPTLQGDNRDRTCQHLQAVRQPYMMLSQFALEALAPSMMDHLARPADEPPAGLPQVTGDDLMMGLLVEIDRDHNLRGYPDYWIFVQGDVSPNSRWAIEMELGPWQVGYHPFDVETMLHAMNRSNRLPYLRLERPEVATRTLT